MAEIKTSKDQMNEAIDKVEKKFIDSKMKFEKNSNEATQKNLIELQFLLDLTKEQVQDENLNRSTR